MSLPVPRLRAFLEERIAAGDLSAGTARVVVGGEVVGEAAAGLRQRENGLDAAGDTVYDLASLTKVVTATLALVLHAEGALPLETEVGELFPEARPGLARHPFEEALRHATGLAAWVPLYAIDRNPEDALRQVLEGAFPPVSGATYSDLGYMVFGRAVERATGVDLEALIRRKILEPLEMESTSARPGPRPEVAECFLDNGRELELAARKGILLIPEVIRRHGTPQDGNARFLGGLAGHAGLFSTVGDLLKLAEEWRRPGRLLDPDLVTRALGGSGRFALGWWRPSAAAPVAEAWPSSSYGMLGFTGGLLWVDPENGRSAVLLGHRVSSARSAEGWRTQFLELVTNLG